jgi:NAD(P)-dependent dehydrogenase (short-subunit alcohol dehydrogenase family)
MSRRVLVTAGASGIGKHIAAAFLAGGDRVYACDIAADALAAAAADLPGLETGLCDVGDRAAVERMVAEAAAELGGLDILVNNAGIAGPTAPAHEVDLDAWDRVVQVNLTGTFTVTHFAIPHLIRSGAGVITIMSSVAGRFGYPNRSPYAATKWALVGLTKTLSMELGAHNIRVNAILPGAVAGERIRRVIEGRAAIAGTTYEAVERIATANQSLKDLVDPADVAALAVFLASPAAKSISGQALSIDGDMQRN